jgi:signal transduction histidine kinase
MKDRFLDLNDTLAREIILNSSETLDFELNKLKKDFNAIQITKVDNPEAETTKCDFTTESRKFYFPVVLGNKKIAIFEVKNQEENLLNHQIIILLSPIFLLIIVTYIYGVALKRKINETIIRPISDILDQSQKIKNDKLLFKFDGNTSEFKELTHQLNIMLQRINEGNKRNLELSQSASLGELAKQVAHDIRSPLASLSMLSGNIVHVPEETRIQLRSSINRIQDIANTLLSKHRKDEINFSNEIGIHIIPLIIDEIVTEKRTLHRSKLNVKIDFIISEENFSLSSHLNPLDFKRVISNLLENSIEAVKNSGVINIKLEDLKNDYFSILIEDNGCGIHQDQLDQLGKEKISFNKQNGNGLGVFHAFQTIERWGGSLDFKSSINQGTKVRIKLKRFYPPKWLQTEINFKNIMNIIVVDDDLTIHQIWDSRFSKINKDLQLRIHHFSSTDALKAELHNINLDNSIFLFDFEFINSKISGLDFIEEEKIQINSILVTSRFDQSDILEKVIKLGIKIIPKNFTQLIPLIYSNEEKNREVILIDDDKFIRIGWKNEAQRKGFQFKSYQSIHDFLLSPPENKNAHIFIDSHLGEGIKGEVVSEEIYQMGFKNLFLTTGYDQINLPYFIKSKFSKEFPY